MPGDTVKWSLFSLYSGQTDFCPSKAILQLDTTMNSTQGDFLGVTPQTDRLSWPEGPRGRSSPALHAYVVSAAFKLQEQS